MLIGRRSPSIGWRQVRPMPQSIPKGLTAEHVLRALADLDAGMDHPFGPPTGYELVHGGRRYPPKAVIRLAYRHHAGRILRPEEFSGGEAPGQAHYVLRDLGFAVERKGREPDISERVAEVGREWSLDHNLSIRLRGWAVAART
jgi:hypothetical protein